MLQDVQHNNFDIRDVSYSKYAKMALNGIEE